MSKTMQMAIDIHPNKKKIDAALCKQVPYRTIASQYGISVTAICRYVKTKFAPIIAQELAKKDEAGQAFIVKELDRIRERMWKYAEAVDEELRDPKDPEKYFLGPQARDIEVVYLTKTGQKRKATLQVLLHRVEKVATVLSTEYKIADPRVMHIRNAEALTKSLVALGKIVGHIQDITVNVTQTQEWTIIKQVIVQSTKDHPEVREKIVAGLKEFED